MNWTTPKLIAETLCLLTVAGSAAFFAWDTHQTQVVTRTAIYNVSLSAYQANATLDSLTGPCVDIQGDYICPPLTQLSQTEKNIGILAARSAQQVQQTATLVNAAAATLTDTGNSVKQVAAKLGTTADALTGTANAATTTIQTAGTTIAAFQPVLGHLDASSADLDAFLKGQMLTKTLPDIAVNFDTATGNLAATTADVRSQVYKWTHPSKTKLTFWTATEAGGDYARHFMPPLF